MTHKVTSPVKFTGDLETYFSSLIGATRQNSYERKVDYLYIATNGGEDLSAEKSPCSNPHVTKERKS